MSQDLSSEIKSIFAAITEHFQMTCSFEKEIETIQDAMNSLKESKSIMEIQLTKRSVDETIMVFDQESRKDDNDEYINLDLDTPKLPKLITYQTDEKYEPSFFEDKRREESFLIPDRASTDIHHDNESSVSSSVMLHLNRVMLIHLFPYTKHLIFVTLISTYKAMEIDIC